VSARWQRVWPSPMVMILSAGRTEQVAEPPDAGEVERVGAVATSPRSGAATGGTGSRSQRRPRPAAAHPGTGTRFRQNRCSSRTGVDGTAGRRGRPCVGVRGCRGRRYFSRTPPPVRGPIPRGGTGGHRCLVPCCLVHSSPELCSYTGRRPVPQDRKTRGCASRPPHPTKLGLHPVARCAMIGYPTREPVMPDPDPTATTAFPRRRRRPTATRTCGPNPAGDPAATRTAGGTFPAAARRPTGRPGSRSSRELGRGGMGVVYLARQVKLKPAGRPQDGARRRACVGRRPGAVRRRGGGRGRRPARRRRPGVRVGPPRRAAVLRPRIVSRGSLAQRLAGTPMTAAAAAELVRSSPGGPGRAREGDRPPRSEAGPTCSSRPTAPPEGRRLRAGPASAAASG